MALAPNQALHVCFCLPKSLDNQDVGGKVVCFHIKESLFTKDASKMHHCLRLPDGENTSVSKPAAFASNILGKFMWHVKNYSVLK